MRRMLTAYACRHAQENVTICFTAIQHLQEMVQLHPEAADVAIELVCQCVRGLLLRFEG